MYTMELKTNLLIITMSGVMTKEEGISYIEELKKNIKDISPIDYNIVVDSRKLEKISKELRESREEAISLIASTPFKKRYNIIPKDIIATMQGVRAGIVNNEFNNTIFAESYGELLKFKV